MATAKTRKRLISDEEQEEEDIIIIPEDSESSEELDESAEETELKPVAKTNVLVSVTDDKNAWWTKLKDVVPQQQQCKIANCQFAPAGHKNHPLFQRSYSAIEIRLIIQYLIHYNDIQNGKGFRVWEDMHSRGYMQHRTVQSLNNNFKRILLRDIRIYNLPEELEKKFLELQV